MSTVVLAEKYLGDHVHPGSTDFPQKDGLKGYRGRNKKNTDEDLIKADLHLDE